MATTVFETQTCTRCGGSGHYSFNLRDGTVCYGCGGKGWQHTRRGAAAHKFYNDLLTVPARSLEPGQRVWDKFAGRWQTVASVDPERYCIQYNSGLAEYYDAVPDLTKRRKPTSEAERLAFVQRALDYQATLTKAGKPCKR